MEKKEQPSNEALAIVGIGCRFPGGAHDPKKLWELLCAGFDGIVEVPQDRWDSRRFYSPDINQPGKLIFRKAGFLQQKFDEFDAQFFNISPREAEVIDPQQRLLLEVSWEAMEDAGIIPSHLKGSNTGVYIGNFAQEAASLATAPSNRELITSHSGTGNSPTILSARISYTYDLRGPCYSLDTACSSSLVSLHTACQAIWNGECDQAMAGGVNLLLNPTYALLMSQGHFLSPLSQCRSFDQDAQGYVRSEGVGIVFIKKLSEAIRDQNPIYAVVRGTAINQDGHTDGLPVPNKNAQAELIKQVLKQSGVNPNDIQYVEAHGTGTAIGDPTEVQALHEGLSSSRLRYIGSIKSNIGHAEGAAGIAGLIKAALCLKEKKIPPNIHFDHPNPKLPFDEYKFRVPTQVTEFPDPNQPLCVAINSFGFGGTNAHVILGEAPVQAQTSERKISNQELTLPLLISARTPQALQELVASFCRYLNEIKTNKNINFADLVYSAALHRTPHEYRLAVMAKSIDDALEKLTAYQKDPDEEGIIKGKTPSQKEEPLAFVYSGIGPQWFKMGRELMASEPRFNEVMQECDRIIREQAGFSLLEELNKDETTSKINQAKIAQPALFSIQVALTELWKSKGVVPDMVIGHSIGEAAAAYASGALSLEEALVFCIRRSQIEALAEGEGGMLAITASESAVNELLKESQLQIDIAAINSPTSVTVSGKKDQLQKFADKLEEKEIFSRFLRVDLPYHNSLLKSFEKQFFDKMISLDPKTSKIPFYSTMAGRKINTSALDADYWWKNITRPVQFAAAMKQIIQNECHTFLEIGPHPVLSASIKECLADQKIEGFTALSLHREKPENQTFWENLLLLHTNGAKINWGSFLKGRYIPLPLYPWQREKYWSESKESMQYRVSLPGSHPILVRQFQMPDPAWQVEMNDLFFDYIYNHRLEGVAIVPGAFYAEAGLALHKEIFGHDDCSLEALEFKQPLFLNPKEERLMLITYSPIERIYNIHSCIQPDHSDWQLHAIGKIYDKPINTLPELPDAAAIKKRCPKAMEREEVYKKFNEMGMEYTGAFQGIKRLWTDTDETIAEIEYNPKDDNTYLLHPATFDSIIQIILMNLNRLLVVQGMDEIHFYRTPKKGPIWVHGRLLMKTDKKASAEFIAWDSEGVFFHADKVRVMFMRKAGEQSPEKLEQNSYYGLSWVPQENLPQIEDFTHQPVLLVSQEDNKLSHVLSDFFKSKQAECIKLVPEKREKIKNDLLHIQPFQKLYVAYLVTENEKNDPDSQEIDNATNFLLFVQQLIKDVGANVPIYLTVVTKGTQFVTEKDSRIQLGGSSLWGMLRVISNENQNIHSLLIDLPSDDPIDSVQLATSLFRKGKVDELALREGKWWSHSFHTLSFEDKIKITKKVKASEGAYELHEDKPGEINSLLFVKYQCPEPGPNDVEVRVHTVLLNFKDLMNVMGLLDPAITENTASAGGFGVECSGTLTKIGSEVKNFKIGDKVIVMPSGGAFRTYLTTSATRLYRIPDCSSIENPVSYAVAATVIRSLKTCAQLKKGETVLIHAGAGGVGLAAIQYAQHVGANIIATAGRKEKKDYLHSLGVEHVTDSRSLNFVNDVMKWTGGRGVDVVLNSLPDDALQKSWSILAPYGRFVEIGKKDIVENHHLPMKVFNENTSFFGVDLDRFLTDPIRGQKLGDETFDAYQQGILKQLPTKLFLASDIASAFHYMARAEQIGKIAVQLEGEQLTARETDESPFHANGTYLITGGCSGLGLELAARLGALGARYLVLTGRRGANTDQAKQVIEQLRNNQVKVLVETVDVADRKGMQALFDKIERELPPLRGVFHSAGVLADKEMMQQTKESFQIPLQPKIKGAWNLHLLTQNKSLDFFVLYSSFISIFGNPNQINYAAGNSFLDSLCYFRHSKGLPCLTINWGSFTETGMSAVDVGVKEYLKTMGLIGFSNEQYFYLLDRVLRYKPVQAAIVQANFEQIIKHYPKLSNTLMFSSVISKSKKEEKQAAGYLKIEGKSNEEAYSLVEEDLKEIISKVIRIKKETLNVDSKLTDFGVDSLLSIEITTQIELAFGVKIPVLRLTGGITFKQLVADIIERCRLEQQASKAEVE